MKKINIIVLVFAFICISSSCTNHISSQLAKADFSLHNFCSIELSWGQAESEIVDYLAKEGINYEINRGDQEQIEVFVFSRVETLYGTAEQLKLSLGITSEDRETAVLRTVTIFLEDRSEEDVLAATTTVFGDLKQTLSEETEEAYFSRYAMERSLLSNFDKEIQEEIEDRMLEQFQGVASDTQGYLEREKDRYYLFYLQISHSSDTSTLQLMLIPDVAIF